MAPNAELPEAVVLAGGRSSRFGSPKPEALFLGRPLLQWAFDSLQTVASRIIVAGDYSGASIQSDIPVSTIPDAEPFQGPLAGATTGLRETQSETALLLSCDAPLLQPELLRSLAAHLSGHDAVVPVVGGTPQPLVALYRVNSTLSAFETAVEAGHRSLLRALDSMNACYLDEAEIRRFDPHLWSFRGINTPADLAALERDARAAGLAPPAVPGEGR